MIAAAYEEALNKFPCPNCGMVGFMHPQRMEIRAELHGKVIHAEGEGTACASCNMSFMDAELTENVANQALRIKHSQAGKYLEVSRDSGSLKLHTIN